MILASLCSSPGKLSPALIQTPKQVSMTIKSYSHRHGLEVIKLEFILRLKIKRNDWLLADTCPQAANHCALF